MPYEQCFNFHHRQIRFFNGEQNIFLKGKKQAKEILLGPTRVTDGRFIFLELYCVLVCHRIVRALYCLLLVSY